jgi:hypothetical protein
MNYSYIGPNSFYRLTIPEIRRLQRGYASLNKTDGKESGPRKSDYEKLEKFKAKLGLDD